MDKAETARWMGYGDDIAAMDAEHDDLHRRLCDWLGIPSLSLELAAGKSLPHDDWVVANHEEDAVLNLQRLIQSHRKRGSAPRN